MSKIAAPLLRALALRGVVLMLLIAPFATSCNAQSQRLPSPFKVSRGISVAPLVRVQAQGGGSLRYDIMPERGSPKVFGSLHAAGLDFIRLVVNPLPLMQSDARSRTSAIQQVLGVVAQARQSRLAVIVDLHFWSPLPDQQAINLLRDPSAQSRFIVGASQIGKALQGQSGVALELLNEPPLCRGGLDWIGLQQRLLKQVRAVAPSLPLVLTGCGGQLDGMLALNALAYANDPNVLYTFHFYDPFIFTHQQTYWGNSRLRSVPFPPRESSPAAFASMAPAYVLAARTDTGVELKTYLHSHEDIDWIGQRIETAADWARRNQIDPSRIILGEFGTNLAAGPDSDAVRADELRWLTAVRKAAEHQGFAWAYWSLPTKPANFDYDPKTNFIRSDVLATLGLRSPPTAH